MRLVTRTYGQNGYDSEMTSAIVDMDADVLVALQRIAQSVRDVQKAQKAVWEVLLYSDFNVDFYEHDLESALEDSFDLEAYNEGKPLLLPASFELVGHDTCRVECLQLRVTVDRYGPGPTPKLEFGWGAYRKHCDVFVTTPTLTLEEWEAALVTPAKEST